MKYKQIKITSKDDPKRFYRVLCVRDYLDLNMLGALIGLSINCWFEHGYMFKADGQSYIPGIWEEDSDGDETYILDDFCLEDLGERFVYVYDTGCGWEFECKVLKEKFEYEDEYGYDNPLAMVIEGKGQGIFENDRATLLSYLKGEIDPESSNEDKKKMYSLPMNMDFEKYGDFDKPLDLEEMIYYEEDIEDIVIEMGGEYREDNIINTLSQVEMQIAYDIFHDEELNKTFKRLIKKYDVNVAYEKIVEKMLEMAANYDEDMGSIEFIKKYKRDLKSLK